MATSTTNLGLQKPDYSDAADIAVLNGNSDKIDSSVNATDGAIAIVSNGNTHPAIPSGNYVYIRGHGSLSEGLYKNSTSGTIGVNATLSSSNVSAISSGGMNEMKSITDTLNGKITNNLSGAYLSASDDLNNFYGYEHTGLYNIGADKPANCPSSWVQLMVIASNSGVSQMLVHEDWIMIRRRTGSPVSWTAWREVPIYDSGWVTFTKDGNNSYAKYRVKGNVVNVIMEHRVSSGAISAWGTLVFGNIPSYARPEYDINVLCSTDRSSSMGCAGVVGTNGNIYISGRFCGASDTSDILRCEITYVLKSYN